MCSLSTAPTPSTAKELSTPLNLKLIFAVFAGNDFVNVLGKIAKTPPPSLPPVIISIAFGHQRPHANVTPSSFVEPNVPFRMCHETSASQFPVVGSASKLHGHPHAQLQLWIYSASKFHFVGID